MWIIVTYDVNTQTARGKNRLRQVAKACEAFGQRVQYSVFECTLNEKQFHEMKKRVLNLIDENQDSVRFYKLPDDRAKRVEEFGVGEVIDFNEPLLV